MPSMNDIMTVAEALEKSPVAVARDKCVAVRNRNATCRRCMNVCTAGAIDIRGNDIALDPSVCNGCGACAVACPTEALIALDPVDGAIVNALSTTVEAAQGRAAIACARVASKRLADPSLYVMVPCLARVAEAHVLAAAVAGARDVLLIDGDCATCKYRDCVAQVDGILAASAELLTAQGSKTQVSRMSGFPQDMIPQSTEGLFGTTRRGFFSEAVGAAKETAMTAARATITQELGLEAVEQTIGERLRVTDAGTLPLLSVPRHDAAINALDALGPSQVESFESRLFATVEVDVKRCNSCGMCATFCPTGALRRDEQDDVSTAVRSLEFWASDCVQCNLCADVCWKGALKVSPVVRTAQLFDFEPVTFKLNTPKKSPSYFG